MYEKTLSKKLGLTVTPSLWEKIIAYYQRTYIGVIPADYKVEDFASERVMSGLTELTTLERLQPHKKGKYLDSGCGLGFFVALGLKNGYDFYGYELDEELIDIAKELLTINKLPANHIFTYEEYLKMKPHQFDLVTSFEVVEHVQDTDLYFQEQARMLTSTGRLFVETPNYLIPFETHFYVFVPPFLPRSLKWWFCQRKGRTNKQFFDELNFITPRKLENACRKAGLQTTNLGIHEWIKALTTSSMENRSIYIKQFSRIINTLHLSFLLTFSASLGIYTPLIYTCRLKKQTVPQNKTV